MPRPTITTTTMRPATGQAPSRANEDGTILASFPRTGPEGEAASLRVYVSEFNGRPILHARQFVRGRSGDWLPTKAGITVRLGEIDAMVAALGRAKALLMAEVAERSAPMPHRAWAGDAAQPPKSEVAGRGPQAGRSLGSVGRSVPDSGLRDVPPWELPPVA